MRRWPRISASSRTPPSEMRTNFRFIARAIDWPSEVLPTPGRADEAEDRALHVPLQLPDREVFDDALLDLVEIVVILVEHAARLDRVEAIVGALRPRHLEHPVEVGADHLVLGRRRRHALEAIDLAVGDGRDVLGQVRLGDPLAQLLDLAVSPRRARTGSPSSAGAARTAAARRSSPFPRATRSAPSARGRRSRARAPSRRRRA